MPVLLLVHSYVDHTGLMWENAADFKALIVFAEHRFFGQSQVTPGADGPSTSEYPLFSVEQAMADYNHFLFEFKQNRSIEDSPVIVFGGSYGGMLAAWLRIKYPETFLGAVAASAPISGFAGQQPEWDSNTYWQVVTRDATPAAGAPAACADNVRNSFVTLFKTGASESGRAHLSDLFRLCKPLGSTSDVQALAMWIAYAWDTMAMGDFPYPSNYLTSNGPMLPAYPVTAACQHLATANLTGDALLQGVLAAASVFTNATANLQCNDVPFDDVEQDGIWDWLFCTETMHQETYFSLDGQRDMFWSQPWNTTFINDHCFKKYGVTPRYTKVAERYGNPEAIEVGAHRSTTLSLQAALAAAGNVVLSNGLLDPWSSAGIKRNISNTVTAIILEHGAHHLDLMFSTPQDPVDVSFARWFEMQRVREWLAADAATRSL
ncbi:uncharacterized protein MONBRDRAFT_33933 [Monosiga brevicollis MX1]|uniref:Lysosomal Pro-X carboxypeptidase n=1 Tax=Monosiga brevicollis TaxID=81824 RepID=A9V8K9_MONBE|nr:uncharacterized protein MONBRDRAFT_33933 [Monosiga brevicollis MX1]EDQ86101.1 predicted protein [Monosiga brevicollis MX1]|eukprot:XP_001749026.1 hypothetical protein [Monosiga brevicollis MX1]